MNKSKGVCGDGMVKGSEQCDDGNKLQGWSFYIFKFKI